MGTLKERIQLEVCLFKPKSLDHDFNVSRKVESKTMATRRIDTKIYIEKRVPSPNLIELTRLTPHLMDERRSNELCFNFDSKYNKGHKCCEKKLFYIDYEEEKDKELEPS